MTTPVRLFPSRSRMFTAMLAVLEPPLKTESSCTKPARPLSERFAGVHTQTNGGPPAELPGGPGGPGGPAGPVTFQVTKLSLAWQSLLELTRRILPLPGLTQVLSVLGAALTLLMGSSNTSAMQPTTVAAGRKI